MSSSKPWQRVFTDEQEAGIAERYRRGAFIGELAEELGTSNKAVNNALRRQGVELRDKREAMAHSNRRRRAKGLSHPNWRGGRSKSADGYVLAAVNEGDPLFEMAKQRGRLSEYRYGYVLEHRLVMARSLGRPLLPEETVHHKNGKRDDNRLANLEIWSSRHPKGQRVDDLRQFAKDILALYPD